MLWPTNKNNSNKNFRIQRPEYKLYNQPINNKIVFLKSKQISVHEEEELKFTNNKDESNALEEKKNRRIYQYY